MPAKSVKQQQKFGAELSRRREGKKSQVPGMTDEAVEDMAATKHKGLPKKVKAKKK